MSKKGFTIKLKKCNRKEIIMNLIVNDLEQAMLIVSNNGEEILKENFEEIEIIEKLDGKIVRHVIV